MRSLFNIVFANVGLGLTVALLFLLPFLTGVISSFVYYNNHLFSEPLRFSSMFVFPYFLVASFGLWCFVLPVFVKFYKADLVKFLEVEK